MTAVALWPGAPVHAQTPGGAPTTTAARPTAQADTQHFTGSQNGVRTDLQLQRRGDRFTGQVTEGGAVLQLSGQATGSGQPSAQRTTFAGQLTGPAGSGLTMAFDADLQGDVLTLRVRPGPGPGGTLQLQRVSGAAVASTSGGATAREGAADGRLDPALVGRWVQSQIISGSGGAGGSASFATERAMTFSADGRAVQTVRSAGGGAGWSAGSGEHVEFRGRWKTRGTDLWLQPEGQSSFVQVGRYALIDGRLVLYAASGRQIWTR